AHPAGGRLGAADRVHDLVRRVRRCVVRRRHAADVPDLPLLGAAVPEPVAAGDRRRRRGAPDLVDGRGRSRGRPPGRGAPRAASRGGASRPASSCAPAPRTARPPCPPPPPPPPPPPS